MPRYSYLCAGCGPFEEMRPMAAFAEPCACPRCGAASPRQLAAAQIAAPGSSGPSPPQAFSARHRTGCACCSPGFARGLRAEGCPP